MAPPKTKIQQALKKRNVDMTGLTYPVHDAPKYYFNLLETDWTQVVNRDANFANKEKLLESVDAEFLSFKKTLSQRTKILRDNDIGKRKIKTSALYKFPLPLQLQDAYTINFDENFSYAGTIAKSVNFITGGRIQAATGTVANSFRSVTLQVPSFRKHTLTWKLSPKSSEESRRLQKMVQRLKKNSHPFQVLGKAVLGFPSIYVPYFRPNTSFMFKFKPCVIENIQINYQGGNQAPSFYKEDGAPESLTLAMTLLELEYWLYEDFQADEDENGIPSNNFQDVFSFYKVI